MIPAIVIVTALAVHLPIDSAANSSEDAPSVGAVVAIGEQEGVNCKFENVDPIELRPPGEPEAWTWVSIAIDQQCRAIVQASWKGQLVDGATPGIATLLALLDKGSDEVPEVAEEQARARSGTACKRSEQIVYMFGWGGHWDRLTTKRGRLAYCWNLYYSDPSVWINTQNGGCEGSSPGWWRWVVDRCDRAELRSGPDPNSVWRTGSGSYHCDPVDADPCKWSTPSGFFHRLFDKEIGYSSGSSKCQFWWDGTQVAGVSNEIVAGCR
jgi:hypothetical protein